MEARFAARTTASDQLPAWRRALLKAINHKQRCRALPPLSEPELARLVAEFHSRGGVITHVATAYVLPTSTAPNQAQVG